MTGQKKHPGGTGVYILKDPGFTPKQREEFLNIVRQWDLKDLDEGALWLGVSEAASVYHAAKKVGDESSVGPIRTNLTRAVNRAQMLRESLELLDGNSRQLVNSRVVSRNILSDADSLFRALQEALLEAKSEYATHGRRPEPERLYLAADLVALLTTCSCVKPIREDRAIFDAFVEEVFKLVGLGNAGHMQLVDSVLAENGA